MNKCHYKCLMLLAGLFICQPASAQWKDWDYELDQEKKPWEELQAQLPPYPKPENLLKFDIGANAANNYYLDANSLSVGEDGIVRYTLVIKTSGGATNVSFEGMRCGEHQLRVYAFGHPNSQWSRARDPGWRPIQYRSVNGHHDVLFRDYLCTKTRKSVAVSVKDILATLKGGGPRVPGY